MRRVFSNPVRTGILLLPVCDAKMISGMACGRLPLRSIKQSAEDQCEYSEPRKQLGPVRIVAGCVSESHPDLISGRGVARVGSNEQPVVDPCDAINPINAASLKETRKRCGE